VVLLQVLVSAELPVSVCVERMRIPASLLHHCCITAAAVESDMLLSHNKAPATGFKVSVKNYIRQKKLQFVPYLCLCVFGPMSRLLILIYWL